MAAKTATKSKRLTKFERQAAKTEAFLRRYHARFAVDEALHKLREARDLLVRAGALRAARRVRQAIPSVEGAQRHAYLAVHAADRHRAAGDR